MVVSTVSGRLRPFWSFHRQYTTTAIHTGATAALAIFGLLVFVDSRFAAVAIGCYVLPPLVLYLLGRDPGTPTGSGLEESSVGTGRPLESSSDRTRPERPTGDTDQNARDTDSDNDDGDTDSDADN
ncbi:hypothetical protein [Natrarchaeobaculum sulfurireducens]|uniref:Uncharacterized protein n=1 Tax=Natrarchaeobaculum sulfurireducens TaxID=2044521 RepID=A0A346PGF9_9EURY|nr:hypothetical protein [Natrarchaeobaculum sulfurireducens]AXR78604.1 hypothetical protein AArc1_2289 [Natrarchaeobaculum sulfurireducens]